MEFADWLVLGQDRGWISKHITCYVHDGPDLTEDEERAIDEAGDMDVVCIPIIRVLA